MYKLSANATSLQKELYENLIAIDKDDNDFIGGEMCFIENESDIKTLLKYIKSGEYINKNEKYLSKSNITTFSLVLHNRREGIMPKDANPYDYVPVEPLNT